MRNSMMRTDSLAQGWMALAGVVLLLVGVIAFVDNPLVGNGDSLIPTGTVHNLVHLATGLLALYIAFGLRGASQASATIGFGILYAIIFVVVLLSPTLFGLFTYAANAYLHIIHLGLAVVSLIVGYSARANLAGTNEPMIDRG